MYYDILINDYVQAIKHLGNRLDKLANFELSYVPESSESLEPLFYSGNFSVVFKLKDKASNYYALKCFTRESIDRFDRYKKITEYLEKLDCKYFVQYEYLENELYITKVKSDLPVLKMSWVNGMSFGQTIRQACEKNDTKTFQSLYDEWDAMCKFLLENQIAHGDLKHDNIIVTSDMKLVLIDYDGMFVPTLSHLKSVENGGSAYQHPKRNIDMYNENLDHFSMLVIKLSLYALIKQPDLFHKYHTSENIIFSKVDFDNIQNSSLIAEIEQIDDQYLGYLVRELKKNCVSNNIENPNIHKIIQLDTNYRSSVTINNLAKRLDDLTRQQISMNKQMDQLFQILVHNNFIGKKVFEQVKNKTLQKYLLIEKFWTNFLPENPSKNEKIGIFKIVRQPFNQVLKEIENYWVCDSDKLYWASSDKDINNMLNIIITKHISNFFLNEFDNILQFHKQLNKQRAITEKNLEARKKNMMKKFGIENITIQIGKELFASEKHVELEQGNNSSKPHSAILFVLKDGYWFPETGEILQKAHVSVNYRY